MASLDFELVGERAVVEVKMRRNPRGWGETGSGTVPDDIWVQVQHQLLATGYDRAYVVAMLAGAPPREFVVERDNAFLDDYRQLVDDFWKSYVLTGTPPPLDGTDSSERLLAERYPNSDGDVIATPEAELLVGQLLDARRRKAEVEREEALVAQRIKDFIGEKSKLIGPGFVIRYQWSKPAKATKWALVATAYRGKIDDLVANDSALAVETRAWLDTVVGLHTSENRPARPFVVEAEEETD